MKYIVEVNAKYLVSIEADSALRAEHAILDYDGIWGALAFDSEAMKTDCFRGACLGCETISMKELEAISKAYADAYVEKAKAEDAHKAANDEVERLEELLRLAKENRGNALQNIYTANKAVAEANEAIGVRKN
jgi:hypothetical protein